MKKMTRLVALVGVLGFVALTGAESNPILVPIEEFCMCGCSDGSIVCVGSINGDCSVPCAQACSNAGM